MEGVHQLIVHAKRTCFSLVSRSGAPTPRNRREAASRCRCSAERSARGVRAQAKHRQTVSFPEKKMDEKRFFCTQLRMEKRFAPSGNRTRVCTVAGYYSTTRPTVLSNVLEARGSSRVIYSSFAIFRVINLWKSPHDNHHHIIIRRRRARRTECAWRSALSRTPSSVRRGNLPFS